MRVNNILKRNDHLDNMITFFFFFASFHFLSVQKAPRKGQRKAPQFGLRQRNAINSAFSACCGILVLEVAKLQIYRGRFVLAKVSFETGKHCKYIISICGCTVWKISQITVLCWSRSLNSLNQVQFIFIFLAHTHFKVQECYMEAKSSSLLRPLAKLDLWLALPVFVPQLWVFPKIVVPPNHPFQ